MTTGQNYSDYVRGDFDHYDPKPPKWHTVKWEKVELMDTDVDERSEYWLVETEDGGRTWQGTATYVYDELAEVEDIELKTE